MVYFDARRSIQGLAAFFRDVGSVPKGSSLANMELHLQTLSLCLIKRRSFMAPKYSFGVDKVDIGLEKGLKIDQNWTKISKM